MTSGRAAPRAAHDALADAVSSNIDGQTRADHVLDEIRAGVSHPDRLHLAAMDAWAAGGTPMLQGFHRRIAKAIERGEPS